jgi:hypothetical protein
MQILRLKGGGVMVKMFFLKSGQLVVAEEEVREGRRFWKRPVICAYEGTKIQLTSMFQYSKGEEFEIVNPGILIEDELAPKMLAHYVEATERFSAGKSGIVLPGAMPEVQPGGISGRKLFPTKSN